jgi:hypothetical protein
MQLCSLPARARPAATILLAAVSLAAAAPAAAVERLVGTPAEVAAAIAAALPGDVVLLRAGTYTFTDKLRVTRPGASSARITVGALDPVATLLRSDTLELFHVSAPFWTFQDLVIDGVCADHSRCEHAFHIVGDARATIVRRTVLRDFNAAIKGNGLDLGGRRVTPDRVIVENNRLYNRTPRRTANPVTAIDVMEGNAWIVRRNLVADMAKDGGNGISYLAFFKGGSRGGVLERNLGIGSLAHTGGTRLGLSLGGGGSAAAIEHTDGVIRNNVLMRFNDVAIYLNDAPGSLIHHNLIYDAAGIDVRFASTATIVNNIMAGTIRNRDGGSSTSTSNLTGVTAATFAQWFVDPARADFGLRDGRAIVNLATPLASVTDDFCGTGRVGAPDLGPIEHVAGTTCPATLRAMLP